MGFASKAGGKRKNKIKPYSSYKKRFRLNKPNAVPHLPAGGFDRPRCGNAHNASCKSKANRRRLRQRTAVPSGYAKVMRKLGFKLGVRHSYVRKGEGGS